MNEEEIKAIRDLKKTIEYYNEKFKENEKKTSVLVDNFDVNNLFILLNLIEKQQAETGRLTTNNEILQGELDRIGIKTLKLKKGSSTDDIITEIEKKDTLINTIQAEFERLENLEDDTDMLKAELKKRDGIVKNIIARLENDIKRITETKAKKSEGLNYLDDYTRNRLQAYKTKTKEIKEYIEKQYFEEIAEYKIKEDK